MRPSTNNFSDDDDDDDDSLFNLEEKEVVSADRAPGPIEEVVVGRNLRNFRDSKAKLKDPNATTHNVLGCVARDLTAGPKIRTISLHHQNGTLTITQPGSGDVPHVVQIGTRTESKDIVFAMLSEILSRLPCTPKELGNDDMCWLLRISRQVAYERDPAIVPDMDTPYVDKHRGVWSGPADVPIDKRYSFQGTVRGIAPVTTRKKKLETWTANIQVPIGFIAKDAKFDLPAGYKWNPVKPKKPALHKQALSDFDAQDVELARQCAMYLVTQYNGYIGSKDNCAFNWARTMARFRTDKSTPLENSKVFSYGPINGKPFWYGPEPMAETHSASSIRPTVEANRYVTKNLTGISIKSRSRKAWSPVFAAALKMLGDTDDVVKAWHEAAKQADDVDALLRAGQTDFPVSDCKRQDRSAHFHACCSCSKAITCRDMEYDNDEADFVCNSCAHTGVDNAGIAPKTSRGKRSAMLSKMIRCVTEENTHRNTADQLTPEEIVKTAEEWIKSDLMPYKVNKNDDDDEQYYDAYFDQTLSTRAPLVKNFKGDELQPKGPTIDAIDPIHKIEIDGRPRTAYHAQNNLAVTSFSANTMVKTNPKVNYLSMGQCRNARNSKEYESGIAMARNAHVNNMESGFSSQHQRDRIDRDVPESYEELKPKYRDGTRLKEIQTHPARLWQTSDYRRPQNIQPGTVPANYGFIKKHTTMIAKHYDMDNPQDRKLWLRHDPYSGEDVPFFFSPFSVTHVWDPWAMVTFYSQRLKRLRTKCDREYARKYEKEGGVRPDFEVETLALEHCHQYMRLISANREKFSHGPWKDKPPSCDSWGIPLFPTVNMPNNVSFGKNSGGGTEMNHGFAAAFPRDEEVLDWSADRTGIEVESQAKNFSRWSLPKPATGEIEQQLDNVRALKGTQIVKIFPYVKGPILLPEPVLVDEIALTKGGTPVDEDDGIDSDEDIIHARTISRRGVVIQSDDDSSEPEVVLPDEPVTEAVTLAPHGRNLSRPGNTCWLSAGIQVLHKIAVLRYIFLGTLTVKLFTGRNLLDDNNAEKHENLVRCLSNVLQELDHPSSHPVGKIPVAKVVDAYDAIIHNPGGLGRFRDSSEFFSDMLAKLITALDGSQLTNRPGWQDLLDAQRSLEEESNPPPVLADDVLLRKQAWKDAGHDSALAELVQVHWIVEQVCQECDTVRREHEIMPFIKLALANPDQDPISLSQLRDAFLLEREPDPHSGKPCRSKYCNNRLTEAHKRIVDAGDILVICVSRFRDRSRGDFAQKIPMNQISSILTLDLAEWSNCEDLPSHVYEPEARAVMTNSRYEVVAIVQYLFAGGYVPHFNALIRHPESSDTWILYDDMQAAPTIVDLDIELSKPGQCVYNLIYRRIGAAAPVIPIIEEVLDQQEDDMYVDQPFSHEHLTSSQVEQLTADLTSEDLNLSPRRPSFSNVSVLSPPLGPFPPVAAQLPQARPQRSNPGDNLMNSADENLSNTDMFRMILDNMQQSNQAGTYTTAKFDQRERELDARERELNARQASLDLRQQSIDEDRKKLQEAHVQLLANEEANHSYAKELEEAGRKFQSSQRYTISLDDIRAVTDARSVPPGEHTSLLQWFDSATLATQIHAGEHFLNAFFTTNANMPEQSRLRLIGYFLDHIPIESLLRFVADSAGSGMRGMMDQLFTTINLDTFLRDLVDRHGNDEILSRLLRRLDGWNLRRYNEIFQEKFMQPNLTRLEDAARKSKNRPANPTPSQNRLSTQPSHASQARNQQYLPASTPTTTRQQNLPTSTPTTARQQNLPVSTPTASQGPPRQNFSVPTSSSRSQYPPSTPLTTHAGLARSGTDVNLRDAFKTPQKDTSKDDQSVEGSGSRYGDPTDDNAKRKVKAGIQGTPSGADRRPGKQSRVGDTTDEPSIPRWQAHTASSLHRRDSNASIQSTASNRSLSPTKAFKNMFSKKSDAGKDQDGDRNDKRG